MLAERASDSGQSATVCPEARLVMDYLLPFGAVSGIGIESNSNSMSGFEDRPPPMPAQIAPPPQMADLVRKMHSVRSELTAKVMLFSMLSARSFSECQELNITTAELQNSGFMALILYAKESWP